jgi:hypothetical protein
VSISVRPSVIPEPFRGEPVALPIESDARVRVHTELGVPIYFCPASSQFTAQMSGVEGRGSTSELRSQSFEAIVDRIRTRALVVPVEAYLLAIDERAIGDEDLVQVLPCRVIEHHARRGEPFVVRLIEPEWRSGRMVARIRAVPTVYLPETDQLVALLDATRALRDEHDRHAMEIDRLGARQRAALDAVRQLHPDDLVRVQESRAQLARPPEALGAVVFDLDADDDAEVTA